MDLDTPIGQLYLVGPLYSRRLEKLNIKTVGDLLFHFPFRYDDFSLISDIARVQPGEAVTIKAEIISLKNEFTKTGKRIQRAIVCDQTGNLEIIWFNQIYLLKTLKTGKMYNFSGKVDWFGRKIAMISPEYEEIRDIAGSQSPSTIHTGRLVPVYPETYGVSSKWLRSRIAFLLFNHQIEINDYLPEEIKIRNRLIDLVPALLKIHFPGNLNDVYEAKKRLSFDELFFLQLNGLKRKIDWQKQTLSHPFSIPQEKILDFIARLPFSLTKAQNRCLKEILTDLSQKKPMNRLLEGDVGSGKTVVAAAAVYTSFLNGFQSAFMAPTEILAEQHYQTLNQLLSPFGLNIKLVTSSHKLTAMSKKPDVYVGTHALIQKNLEFEELGLVIIDEQHRFGVEQRAKLANKGQSPHLLTMTATPIPRTVALILYGDLDLSLLDEMPTGRQKVKTWVVPPQKREAAYNWIRERVKGTDEQAFIVCPLIEESETLKSVKAVRLEYENLVKNVFPDLRLGLLHGKMKNKEKEEVITKFRQGKLDILVSTPVVEVGIDIPQATIMMIESADRFGLAQLHQLRGRVGRGEKQAYCLLFAENAEGRVLERLKTMEKINIGSKLAEIDLSLRGPGEIYGTSQHGFPDLRLASYTDLELIQKTKEEAEKIIPKLKQFPFLYQRLQNSPVVKPN